MKQQMLGKVIQAAEKLMYSPQTRPLFMKLLDREGDRLEIAADAAVKVTLTIVDDVQGKVNPSFAGIAGALVAPAGVAILGDVLDFMQKTENLQVTEEMTHKAIGIFLQKLDAAVKAGGDSIINIQGAQNGA
ncbi:MAG TPA: hypothetical protein VK149_12375 [Sideroxyarcus sp.]|nr:hypothetical protein [Sideroxyarcus sp.]